MKKILCFFLVMLMCVSLSACGGKCKITWESTPEECIKQMKKGYKISDDDIDYEPSDSSLCEFNFYEDVEFEDFEEAELEFCFDDDEQLVEIRVYDDGSDAMDVENILNLAQKYLGEETEAKFNYRTGSGNIATGTLYYWNDGETGAYIHVEARGGPYITFVNLNTEYGKEIFEQNVDNIKID